MTDLVGEESGRPCEDHDASVLLVRTEETISAVADLARRDPDATVPAYAVDTLQAAVDRLRVGERYLRRRLAESGGAAGPDAEVLALLVRVQSLRLVISEAQVHRRAAVTAELHRSLTRLRSGLSMPDLLRQIPLELGQLGFSRSLVSDLRGTTWAPRSAFVHYDESLAAALVEVGSAIPGRIGREVPETEMVRARHSVLVRDAQNNPRIHRELISLADTRDYAGAPVVVHGTVVGLLHVDRYDQADAVDSADRDLLGLFADGVGLAFERARYQERFSALKRQFERQITGIDELFYGSGGWNAPAEPADPQQIEQVTHPYLSGGPLGELTRRELEVLRHLAGGATNQDIADRLVVSTGTVKTHVKSVLRKLGAANRAEAAARFHALTRPHPA
ncbi:LuxR C-terminal-related transcriptional regulator [Pseudonocardia sp. NPDC049154]|uniref:LuxR C-terminal-related transcriptional regulator n=1 Tax=Pseudonocardia sp. NPDC049154 TaxID=3155501 RepID=UPI0033C4F6D3